jgi:O-antigen/teichoic acid export membrane protein
LVFLYVRWMRPRVRADETASKGVEFGRIGKYALLNLVSAPGVVMFDYSIDFLLISRYLNDELLGSYAFSIKVSRMFIQMLPQKMMETVIRPAFYAKYSSPGDKTRSLQEMFNTLCRMNLAFLLPMAVVLILGGKRLIPLLGGAKYLDAYPTLICTFVFLCVSFFELPSDLVIQAIEKIVYRSIAQVFSILRFVAAIVILKSGHGILGLAFAAGGALLAKNLFLYYFARKHAGIRFEWRSFAKIGFNALCAAAALQLCLSLLPGWPSLAAGCCLSGAVYLGMMLLVSPFTTKEKEQMLYIVRRGAR